MVVGGGKAGDVGEYICSDEDDDDSDGGRGGGGGDGGGEGFRACLF